MRNVICSAVRGVLDHFATCSSRRIYKWDLCVSCTTTTKPLSLSLLLADAAVFFPSSFLFSLLLFLLIPTTGRLKERKKKKKRSEKFCVPLWHGQVPLLYIFSFYQLGPSVCCEIINNYNCCLRREKLAQSRSPSVTFRGLRALANVVITSFSGGGALLEFFHFSLIYNKAHCSLLQPYIQWGKQSSPCTRGGQVIVVRLRNHFLPSSFLINETTRCNDRR